VSEGEPLVILIGDYRPPFPWVRLVGDFLLLLLTFSQFAVALLFYSHGHVGKGVVLTGVSVFGLWVFALEFRKTVRVIRSRSRRAAEFQEQWSRLERDIHEHMG
jgi:hypothetical protein